MDGKGQGLRPLATQGLNSPARTCDVSLYGIVCLAVLAGFGFLVYRHGLTKPRLTEVGKIGVMLLLLIGMFVGALLSISLLYLKDLLVE